MHAESNPVDGHLYVPVPRELLLEVIAHVDAFASLGGELSDHADSAAIDALRGQLLELFPDAPSGEDDDETWNAHPMNVAYWSRSSEIVGSFLARLDEEWLRQDRPPAAFFEHAVAIRAARSIDVMFPSFPREPASEPLERPKSETRQILDELLERNGLDRASEARRSFQVIPGGAA